MVTQILTPHLATISTGETELRVELIPMLHDPKRVVLSIQRDAIPETKFWGAELHGIAAALQALSQTFPKPQLKVEFV